jgi:glycolate oxidase FAD binding subunit
LFEAILDLFLCPIDGFGPVPISTPQSVAELCDLVRSAAADDQAIYPFGGQTLLDFGLPPTRAGIGLDLRCLAQVIDYPARDMTITVQAGITLAKLQDLLATENQRLPVDVPQPERATLGGALATNMSGPRRYGFGTLRDYVIGISVVNDEGQEIKAGGRVVKNVAGYDLCKLYIGSLGTLGIMTQVTLKLKPRPEEQALILVGCGHDALEPLLQELHRSRTRPVCLDLLNQAAVQYIIQQADVQLPETPWVLAIGFEDNREAVLWQRQQILAELASAGFREADARIGSAAEPLWRALAKFPNCPEARLTFKANMLPRTGAGFCRLADTLPQKLMLQAHAGNGIVIGHAGNDLMLEQARTMLKVLQDSAVASQGNVIVRRCPTAWKSMIPVWGAPRGDVWLMRAVKEKLDPRRRFNPGRFIDGI